MSERPVEEMDAFFDARAHGYDSHMERTVTDFAEFYQAIATEITPTSQPVSILDIGCGTGLELSGILAQAPQAQLTCNDLSLGMLEKLKPKYHAHADQISFFGGIIHGAASGYKPLRICSFCHDSAPPVARAQGCPLSQDT
jgi:ubiquinone/menaquinone biosynthesis C-methylase UbiE